MIHQQQMVNLSIEKDFVANQHTGKNINIGQFKMLLLHSQAVKGSCMSLLFLILIPIPMRRHFVKFHLIVSDMVGDCSLLLINPCKLKETHN